MRRFSRPVFAVALLTPLLAGVFLATPAGAVTKATAKPGSIEICKVGNNITNTSVQFTLNGGSPITVAVGGCSDAISAPAGLNTVKELIPSGTQVQKIQVKPAIRLVGKNKGAGTVTVNVPAGSTGHRETVVTYTDEPQGGLNGNLKICKVAGDPSLLGDKFSFTENGGSAFSIAAGSPPGGICSSLTSWPQGTVVSVAELPTSGTEVSSISVSDGRGSNVDTVDGTVDATIGEGVTTVTYTNIPTPPPQTGYMEICWYGTDPYAGGTFDYAVTAPGGFTHNDSAVESQCTGLIQVPAGNVDIAQTPRTGYYLDSVEVEQPGRLVTDNLSNQTAEVTVPQGDSSQETVVNFYNDTTQGQLKICKTLAANSNDLNGQTFYFDVWSSALNESNTVSIVVGGAGSTSCKFFPYTLPTGSTVSVTEESFPNVQLTGVSVSPPANDNGSTSTTANATISSGVTVATFTNQELGTIEICKNVKTADYNVGNGYKGFPFKFSVNGGAPFTVQSGLCSNPIQVPAGTATVEEYAAANFHFVSLTATGPGNDNRVVSGPNTDSSGNTTVTVKVPYGGVGNETLVQWYNDVNTGQLKICKSDPNASTDGLANYEFEFTYSYTVNGTPVTGTVDLTPGQCWLDQTDPPIPVIDANGNAIPVRVVESDADSVYVSEIDYAGNGSVVNQSSTPGESGDGGWICIDIGQGVNQVTFVNARSPLNNAGTKGI